MELKDIRCEVEKLAQLVEGWTQSGHIAQIERDLALEKFRALYDAVRFVQEPDAVVEQAEQETLMAVPLSIELGEMLNIDPASEPVADPEPEPTSEPQPEPTPEPMPEPLYAPEPEPIAEAEPEAIAVPAPAPVFTPKPEPESNPEPESDPDDVFEEVLIEISVAEPTPAPEPEIAPAPAPAPEPEIKPAPQPVIGSLFGMESDDTLRHKQKQRVIMSLYNTEPAAPESPRVAEPAPLPTPAPPVHDQPSPTVYDQPSPMPEPVISTPEPIAVAPEISEQEQDEVVFEEVSISSGAVLGEVINQDVQTLGDKLTQPHSSEMRREPITDLRRAIGINDKFLLINDLFGGDAEKFESVIETLNGFDDLDDCMIHIAENYIWNPNSDGAKLLMELLERKFA